MENNGAGGDLKCEGTAQEVSEEKNVSWWPRDCSCDILVKYAAAICPCLKTLPESNLKSFGFNCFGREDVKTA